MPEPDRHRDDLALDDRRDGAHAGHLGEPLEVRRRRTAARSAGRRRSAGRAPASGRGGRRARRRGISPARLRPVDHVPVPLADLHLLRVAVDEVVHLELAAGGERLLQDRDLGAPHRVGDERHRGDPGPVQPVETGLEVAVGVERRVRTDARRLAHAARALADEHVRAPLGDVERLDARSPRRPARTPPSSSGAARDRSRRGSRRPREQLDAPREQAVLRLQLGRAAPRARDARRAASRARRRRGRRARPRRPPGTGRATRRAACAAGRSRPRRRSSVSPRSSRSTSSTFCRGARRRDRVGPVRTHRPGRRCRTTIPARSRIREEGQMTEASQARHSDVTAVVVERFQQYLGTPDDLPLESLLLADLGVDSIALVTILLDLAEQLGLDLGVRGREPAAPCRRSGTSCRSSPRSVADGYDPSAIEPRWQEAWREADGPGDGPGAYVLVRFPAVTGCDRPRPRQELRDRRRLRALPPRPRRRRPLPARLRGVRDRAGARRRRGAARATGSTQSDRAHARPARPAGLLLRLVARVLERRPGGLPLVAGALPRAAGGRSRRRARGIRRVVRAVLDRPRARPGARQPVRALRPGRLPHPAARVVSAHEPPERGGRAAARRPGRLGRRGDRAAAGRARPRRRRGARRGRARRRDAHAVHAAHAEAVRVRRARAALAQPPRPRPLGGRRGRRARRSRALRDGGWRTDSAQPRDGWSSSTRGSPSSRPSSSRRSPWSISHSVDARFGPTAALGIPDEDPVDAAIKRKLQRTGGFSFRKRDERLVTRTATRYRASDLPISRPGPWGAPVPVVRCGTVPGRSPVPA